LYINWLHRNEIEFVLYLSGKRSYDRKFIVQYSVFYEEYEKKKKNGKNFFDIPDEDLNPGPLKKFAPTI
jgi:hypothetical protein